MTRPSAWLLGLALAAAGISALAAPLRELHGRRRHEPVLGSDTSISSVDAHGVALAAIQGLHAKLAEQAREIERLRAIVERLAASR